jgi:hypothetical protein
MKQIQSITEGTWVELVPVQLTEEQQTLMMSRKEEDLEAKTKLAVELKSKREKALTKAESKIAQGIYTSLKPELKETDVYQLISVDMTLTGETGRGIINCRVNGEHKQIRF